MVLVAVSKRGNYLKYASEELRNNKEFMEKVIAIKEKQEEIKKPISIENRAPEESINTTGKSR